MQGIEFVFYGGYKLRLVALVLLKLIPRPSPKTAAVPEISFIQKFGRGKSTKISYI